MRSASFWLSLFFILFYISYSAFQLLRNLWLSKWSDANDNGKHDPMSLGTRLSVYAALGVIEASSFAIALVCLIFGGLRASKRLHGPMLHQILRAPMAFFDTTPLGRILNRFGKDIDVVDTMLPMNFRYFLMCLTNVASTVLIICISTPIFIVVAIILVFVYYYALVSLIVVDPSLYRIFLALLRAGQQTIEASGKQLQITHIQSLLRINPRCYLNSSVQQVSCLLFDFQQSSRHLCSCQVS